MYGAILGDIIGSPYEFDSGEKTKDFPLFSENSVWTDDTVMTIAVAGAFLTAATGKIHALLWQAVPQGRLRSAVLEVAPQLVAETL